MRSLIVNQVKSNMCFSWVYYSHHYVPLFKLNGYNNNYNSNRLTDTINRYSYLQPQMFYSQATCLNTMLSELLIHTVSSEATVQTPRHTSLT